METKVKKVDGSIFTKTLDDDGRIIKISIKSEDPKDDYEFTSNYEYNDNDDIIAYSDSEGRELNMEYDKLSRLIWKRSNDKEMNHYIYEGNSEKVSRMEVVGDGKILTAEISNTIPDKYVMTIETNDEQHLDVVKCVLGMLNPKRID